MNEIRKLTGELLNAWDDVPEGEKRISVWMDRVGTVMGKLSKEINEDSHLPLNTITIDNTRKCRSCGRLNPGSTGVWECCMCGQAHKDTERYSPPKPI